MENLGTRGQRRLSPHILCIIKRTLNSARPVDWYRQATMPVNKPKKDEPDRTLRFKVRQYYRSPSQRTQIARGDTIGASPVV